MPTYTFTLEEFIKEMARQAAGIVDAEKRIVIVAAQAILANLENDTPVDTGRARSNWLTTLGSPWNSGAIPPFAPGSHLGKAERANKEIALSIGNAVLTGRGSEIPVFITNRAPYIGELNEGKMLRPENRPVKPGFVEAAIFLGLNSAEVKEIEFITPAYTSKIRF